MLEHVIANKWTKTSPCDMQAVSKKQTALNDSRLTVKCNK